MSKILKLQAVLLSYVVYNTNSSMTTKQCRSFAMSNPISCMIAIRWSGFRHLGNLVMFVILLTRLSAFYFSYNLIYFCILSSWLICYYGSSLMVLNTSNGFSMCIEFSIRNSFMSPTYSINWISLSIWCS